MATDRFTQVEKVLKARRDELISNLERRDGIQIEQAPDALDAVQNLMMREFAVDQIDRESRLLRQIEDALARIARGAYGTCAHCEEDISPKRLAAVPWASLCIHCQHKADRDDSSGRPRAFQPNFEYAAVA